MLDLDLGEACVMQQLGRQLLSPLPSTALTAQLFSKLYIAGLLVNQYSTVTNQQESAVDAYTHNNCD